MLSGCASFGDVIMGMRGQPSYYAPNQTQQYPQDIRVTTTPYVIEQPETPAPDRYLYQK